MRASAGVTASSPAPQRSGSAAAAAGRRDRQRLDVGAIAGHEVDEERHALLDDDIIGDPGYQAGTFGEETSVSVCQWPSAT